MPGDLPTRGAGALGTRRAPRARRRQHGTTDRAVGRRARPPRLRVNRPAAEVEYLDLEDLLGLTRALHAGPVRDLGLLDSACARPRSSAFGRDAYPTLHGPRRCCIPWRGTTHWSMATSGSRGSRRQCSSTSTVVRRDGRRRGLRPRDGGRVRGARRRADRRSPPDRLIDDDGPADRPQRWRRFAAGVVWGPALCR